MDTNESPPTETRSALVPPGRNPPTAIGTDAPEPPGQPSRPRGLTTVHTERHVYLLGELRPLVNKLLDTIDRAGESIAVELGLREAKPGATPPAPGGHA